jgi:U3 small nucleolar RNA-associated protein 14
MAKTQTKDKTPKLVDHVSDSSDEEIDEDLAFNSEDERKYGALFNEKKKSSKEFSHSDDDDDDDDSSADEGDSDDSDSSEQSYDDDDDSDGIASDDDDEDGDGGQYMLDLLNNLDANKEDLKKQAKEDAKKALAHSTMMKESEYSTMVKRTDLTLDELMSGIADTKGFGNVQKAMKDMTSDLLDGDSTKRLSTTKAPVAKVISNRAQRKVAYEENVNEVSQWITAVKRNREAETLDFRPKDRIKISKDELVVKFEPTTEFEKEMAAALEEAGAADEKEIMKQEGHDALLGLVDYDDDDLGRNQLSAEEYKKRRGELAKLRALMFYEEQKRHHMNKIKSKKYRKIRKKQRMRLKESDDAEAAEQDDDYARELEEKAEMERMKERMSLKHRNTSKWAKRVLRRGANVDADTRKALSEQVRIGDELKKKMKGNYSDDDDNDDEDDSNLLDQARAILTDMEQNHDEQANKGLFKLDFMKKGLEAQRERAKQEARELLRELEANEKMGSSDDEERNPNSYDKEDEDARSTMEKKRKKVASAKEMETVLPKGKLVATSLEFGNSNAVSVSGAIDLDVEGEETVTKSSPSENTSIDVTLSNVESTVEHTETDKYEQVVSKEPIRATVANCSTQKENVDDNPWLRKTLKNKNVTVNTNDHKGKSKKILPSVTKEGIINIADAINVISGNDNEEQKDISIIETSQSSMKQNNDNKVKNDLKIASMSQQDLVRQAFATVSDKDVQDEFDKEKDAMRERDDHSKKVKPENNKVSGWGSWAGEGVPPQRPPKKLPKHLEPPEKKIPKRRREDDGKKGVIINAKRIKKTAKFQIENIPYPYASREQYERAIAGAMGAEWNVSGAVKDMTRPEVITRPGKMIRPISKKAKMKRAPLVKF